MNVFREVRLFVIFDLPVKTSEETSQANKFRRQLLKEGFYMMQYSVYVRFCRNDTEYKKYLKRIKKIAPTTSGDIQMFHITEKQFQNMYTISKKYKSDEDLLSINPMIVIE